jgi:drug/metabolite transporter (DMT)-like permease
MTRQGWALFGALCVFWGVPYLLIKVAVDDLSPASIVLGRTVLGAAILLPLAAIRGQLRPALSRWKPILLFAVVEMCVPWPLLGFAETRLPSSLTGLLIAAVPLVGAVLMRVGPAKEHLDPRRALGLGIGIAGVSALVGFDLHGGDGRAVGAVAIVVIGYAVGPMILSQAVSDLPGLGVIAVALTMSAVISAPLGIAQAPGHWPSAKVIASVVALAVVCTAAAFLVFFALIAEVGPVRASVVTYVNPAVAVLLGVTLLDEQFTLTTAIGFALILAGSVLATAGARRASPSAAREIQNPAAAMVDTGS